MSPAILYFADATDADAIKRLCPTFPEPPPCTGDDSCLGQKYLYAVEVADQGIVKVGVSREPAVRFQDHQETVSVHYEWNLGSALVTEGSYEWGKLEAKLKRRLRNLGHEEVQIPDYESEWFLTDLAAAGREIQGLDFPPLVRGGTRPKPVHPKRWERGMRRMMTPEELLVHDHELRQRDQRRLGLTHEQREAEEREERPYRLWYAKQDGPVRARENRAWLQQWREAHRRSK